MGTGLPVWGLGQGPSSDPASVPGTSERSASDPLWDLVLWQLGPCLARAAASRSGSQQLAAASEPRCGQTDGAAPGGWRAFDGFTCGTPPSSEPRSSSPRDAASHGPSSP